MSLHHNVFIVTVAGLIINALAFVLRIWIRMSKRSFGYDDAVLSASFVAYILGVAFTLAVLYYGYGISSGQPRYNNQDGTHYFFATQPTSVLAAGLVKGSIALILLRIEIRKRVRMLIIVPIIIYSAITLALFFLLFFKCRPLSLIWSPNEAALDEGCIPWLAFRISFFTYTIADFITQWLLSLLPIAMLWNIQMNIRDKIPVLVLFGIGIVSSIGTAVKLAYFLRDSRHTTVEEVDLQILLWSHVEVGLGLLVAILVACGDALKKFNNLFILVPSRVKSKRRTSSSIESSTEGHSYRARQGVASDNSLAIAYRPSIRATRSEDPIMRLDSLERTSYV
ncbi:hypothetical protein F4777DRAFT_404990 [Nemania sp. FL0916]|nr:hypothetical protein F4777DRAFT_404990 [Nemania sp. FL0916]